MGKAIGSFGKLASVGASTDPKRRLTVLQTVRSALRAADYVGAQNGDGRACGAGCSHCCHGMVVNALPEEIDQIIPLVTPEQAKKLSESAKLDDDQYWEVRQRCAFLGDDERCTIYEERPLTCRLWMSTDKKACEDASIPGKIENPQAPLPTTYQLSVMMMIREDKKFAKRFSNGGDSKRLDVALASRIANNSGKAA